MKHFLLPLAVLLAAVAAGMLYQAWASRRDRRTMTGRGRFVTVQGKQVFVCERGPVDAAGPTIVFESGMVASGLNFYGIQQTLDAQVRTFSYDRLGLGWSDAATCERTPVQLAAELHDALVAAGARPPYLFVGHSYGAMIVRIFALEHPAQVAGIVFIDAMRIDGWLPGNKSGHHIMLGGRRLMRRAYLPTWLGLTRWAMKSLLEPDSWRTPLMHKLLGVSGRRSAERMTRELTKMAPEVQPEIAAQWSLPRFYSGCYRYIRDIPAGIVQMQQSQPIEGIPVILIRPRSSPPASPGYLYAVGPETREIVVEDSGHWVHLDRPELVEGILLDMLAQLEPDLVSQSAQPNARTGSAQLTTRN